MQREMEPQDVDPASPNNPISLLFQITKTVPATKYALGLVGVAIAASIVLQFVGSGRAAIFVMLFTFVGMIMMVVFSTLTGARRRSINRAGELLVWVTIIYFVALVGLIISAVAFRWPPNLAHFLGWGDPHEIPAPIEVPTSQVVEEFEFQGRDLVDGRFVSTKHKLKHYVDTRIWIEFIGNLAHFAFIEKARDDKWIWIVDDTRQLEIRLPIAGGISGIRAAGGSWSDWSTMAVAERSK